MRWLTDCSPATVAEAVRMVAPQLGGASIELSAKLEQGDPLWSSSTAIVGGQFIAKFAWSRPAAWRLAHEIGVLTALAREPGVPFLPVVVAAGSDPLLLITRRVPGRSLFEVVHSIEQDSAGRQLAGFLAVLHAPASRERVEAAIGRLPEACRGPQHPAATRDLRDRLGRWIRPDQRRTLTAWCEWVDATLAPPRPSVLVHADLHGDNQVWTGDKLRLVVDFETVSAAEPEYDLRAIPTVELLTATMHHYHRLTGRRLAIDRVTAWHVRTALGDALWHSEAGRPLPDGRTPSAWIDELTTRFEKLGSG